MEKKKIPICITLAWLRFRNGVEIIFRRATYLSIEANLFSGMIADPPLNVYIIFTRE